MHNQKVSQKPTLRTLASELGLSVTTVSRALANYEDVSPRTREKVHLAAERAGYVPDQSARRLVTGRSDAVGVVLPYPGDEEQDPYSNDPFISELLRHIARGLQHHPQLDLIVGYAHDDGDSLDVYRRFVQGRRVDGFFVARTQIEDERVEYLLSQNVPFVCHGRTRHAERHAWVDTNAGSGFEGATRRLIALGHERIALLNLPLRLYTAGLRSHGYRSAMAAAGLEPVERHCEVSMGSGYEAGGALLRGDRPPTALLCASDILAVGALRAARERGLIPGKNFACIGADNLPLARLLEPELASVTDSNGNLGEIMVEMLSTQLQQQSIVPQQRLVDFRLIERGSLCARVP